MVISVRGEVVSLVVRRLLLHQMPKKIHELRLEDELAITIWIWLLRGMLSYRIEQKRFSRVWAVILDLLNVKTICSLRHEVVMLVLHGALILPVVNQIFEPLGGCLFEIAAPAKHVPYLTLLPLLRSLSLKPPSSLVYSRGVQGSSLWEIVGGLALLSSTNTTPSASSMPGTTSNGDLLLPDQFASNVSSPSRKFTTQGDFSRSPTNKTTTSLSSDSGETDTSGDESDDEREGDDKFDTHHSPQITRLRPAIPDSSIPSQPRFSRAFSLPLPSQLGYLQHPHKASSKPYFDPPNSESSQLSDLSMEVADCAQMLIQMMLQISPSQVLESAKESLTACSLAVPTSSMSAMLTTMKHFNYIAANMGVFCPNPSDSVGGDKPLSTRWSNFDIGELVQSVGDAVSGAAAQVGVELVPFHGDVGLKHVWVKGDESGLSYLLVHLLRQILAIAQRGDTIEIGLFLGPIKHRQNSMVTQAEEDTLRELEGPLQITIEILHKFASKPNEAATNHATTRSPFVIGSMSQRLLRKVGASYHDKPSSPEVGHACQLQLTLDAGTTPTGTPLTVTSSEPRPEIAREPSLEQLAAFVESLKGKKVTLYANARGPFAHHLTSYLTAWGLDVSHVSDGVENPAELPPSPSTSNIEGYTPTGIPAKAEPRQPKAQPPSFIFIDDDVAVLRERMENIRSENSFPRKRPSLAMNHRPRSSPQVARLQSVISSPGSHNPAVILHFTSLSNFKIVKDLVQSVLGSCRGPLPEIMIIPKPAGPRRFLTALHTATTKPMVDPFFAPLATSPMTPSFVNGGNYFNNTSTPPHSSPRTPSVTHHRPSTSRSGSDHSLPEILEREPPLNFQLPPSPLSQSDAGEYFQSLGSSPSSGFLIQNADGPQGIFFHPKPRGDPVARESIENILGIAPRKPSLPPVPTPDSIDQATQMVHLATNDATRPPLMWNPASSSRSNSRVSFAHRSDPGTRSGSLSASRRSSAESAPRVTSPTVPQPGSPGSEYTSPVARAAVVRRSTQDSNKSSSATPTNKMAKAKAAEGDFVPPISVLIVDDNPINRTILGTFMKKRKIKHDIASNGKEAVEKWQSGEFHLILMDIQMPVMDGIAATRAIRQIEQAKAGYVQTPAGERQTLASTPSETSSETRIASPYRSSVIIVALTASSFESDRIAALGAGCNDFLTKPVSLQWLQNKLIEWGSIKALQMYADPLTDVSRKQSDRARDVAEKLHVPKGRKTPPSPSTRTPVTTPSAPGNAVAGPSNSPGIPSGKTLPASATSSAFWSPGQPSAATTFWNHMGIASPSLSSSGTQQSADASASVNGDLSEVAAIKSAGAAMVTLEDSSKTETPTRSPILPTVMENGVGKSSADVKVEKENESLDWPETEAVAAPTEEPVT
ncbi:hypothetical protein D9758_007483 [Tetrapyrgos nigripes]|uniref:Response regulatory domain-containing protein n=1 Tax=Tetrapyrgos nigripes TaxID=182062 RepID=A0A8H5G3K6_9AGAR|nr:hypothetical protein D9758_007483 [Tetrapyrgos nigripes]